MHRCGAAPLLGFASHDARGCRAGGYAWPLLIAYWSICGSAIVRNWKRPALLKSQVSEISTRPRCSKCDAGLGNGAVLRSDVNAVLSVARSWLVRMISLRSSLPPASIEYLTTITERSSACG